MSKKQTNSLPLPPLPPKSVGPYGIVRSLGRGGMGEVFLAEDPICGRQVALKRVRPELLKAQANTGSNPVLQKRFLREAKVASTLSHPSIVPILAIHNIPPDIYYTMPYVEGETLRQILKATQAQEKVGSATHPISRSIPMLARCFLQVCEAIAYTHSKRILHRDLKPENIIVGKYGEVMILDWGIADFIDALGEEEPVTLLQEDEELTRPGKVTGTLAYMAPERLVQDTPSVQIDIYALGVILYQILTLQLPFQRKTISDFRKRVHLETLVDPIEMAPYRDIPHQLSSICQKCLKASPQMRYQSVEDLIADLKNYIEGRPEWALAKKLDVQDPTDWRLQENILPAKNIAITRDLDVTEWVALMVSKASFANTLRIEAKVRLEAGSQGLGFLFSIPEHRFEEGYCLWIGSPKSPSCRLFRNNVQMMEVQKVYLQPNIWHHIRIEKIEESLKFYLDGQLKITSVSHIPLAGTHVGLLHKDADFKIEEWKVYDGSHNALVGCLAVPNALLSHKLYDAALEEYRRIGRCFPGRVEGREALFRAGVALLEKKQYLLSLKEFEHLHNTPGAPLEYLGKSLVYEALSDWEEEAKCLELALRKFPKHPLLSILKEHIVYRMHESSLNNRDSAYRIILLSIRHIPDLLQNPDTDLLIQSLEKNLEPLPFLQGTEHRKDQVAVQLAFWLRKIPILIEMAKTASAPLLQNILFCLLELDATEALESLLPEKPTGAPLDLYTMRQELKKGPLSPHWQDKEIPKHLRIYFEALFIWNHLLLGELKAAKQRLEKYPPSALAQESSPLHFPYGTWIYLTKGKQAAFHHFSQALDTPYPPTTALPSLFLIGHTKKWMAKGFWWEKKELHRQIDLFYRCVGKK